MNNQMITRILIGGALAASAASIVWGFTLIGGPAFNRKVIADKERRENLKALKYSVETYFERHGKLPETAPDLETNTRPYQKAVLLKDPTTEKEYGYRVIDPSSYELCAEFELTAEEGKLESGYSSTIKEPWSSHGVGHNCFRLEIPAEIQKKSGAK